MCPRRVALIAAVSLVAETHFMVVSYWSSRDAAQNR
jgi:heme-degrading monooxygenase HmoA